MRVGPRTPTTPIARPGRPYGARTSETSRISSGWFSWPMNTWTRPGAGDAADELAEVGPVLEGAEDAAELLALGELGCLHDVEQAVAEDLLDRRGVVLADDLDDALADAPGEGVRRDRRRAGRRGGSRRAVAVMSTSRSLSSAATALSVGWSMTSSPSRVTSACLIAPSRSTRMRLAIRSLIGDEVDPPDVGVARLGRRRQPGSAGDRGERRRRQPEPVLAGELHLAELVADHQLLDGRQAGPPRRSTRRRSDSRSRSGSGPRRCAGGSAGRSPRARRGCCGRSRWTRRGGSARRAPGCRPAWRW